MIIDKTNLTQKLPTIEVGELLVVGKPISEEQAISIIKRTDLFIKASFRDSWSSKFKNLPKRATTIPDTWKYINLSYFSNDFISPMHYTGFQGWCHPNGTIYSDFNSETTIIPANILKEANILAEEFNFLDFLCIVFNKGFAEFTDEGVAPKPVYAIQVKEGNATCLSVNQGLTHLLQYVDDPVECIVQSWIKKGKETRYQSSVPMEVVKSWY